MTLRTIKSYDLKPTIFTREATFAVAELLEQRARTLVTAEASARENADQQIIDRFVGEISAINIELAKVKLAADVLGDAELGQLEDSLVKVLSQPAFQDLLSGGTLEGYKLNSIVRALAAQPDPAYTESLGLTNGVSSGIKIGLTDGRSSVFTADIVAIAADEVAGTPERMRYDYKSADFMGLPAIQSVLFNVHRFAGSDKPWLEEVRRDLVLFDFTADFVPAGPAPVLVTPDLNADQRIGTRDLVAEALAKLGAALAEKAAAIATVETANIALTTAQALATQHADAYATLQTDTAQQVTDATALVATKTTARDEATAAIALAQQALSTAQEMGGDVEAATALLEALIQDRSAVINDLGAAQMALDALTSALVQASNLSAQSAASVTAQQSGMASLQDVAAAKTALAATAQSEYDAAVLARSTGI